MRIWQQSESTEIITPVMDWVDVLFAARSQNELSIALGIPISGDIYCNGVHIECDWDGGIHWRRCPIDISISSSQSATWDIGYNKVSIPFWGNGNLLEMFEMSIGEKMHPAMSKGTVDDFRWYIRRVQTYWMMFLISPERNRLMSLDNFKWMFRESALANAFPRPKVQSSDWATNVARECARAVQEYHYDRLTGGERV